LGIIALLYMMGAACWAWVRPPGGVEFRSI
jgi:hypothetical protein